MAFHFHSHHFHFVAFRNKEIDSLYFTLALICFAEGLIAIFIPIYLWNLGYPMWQIIFFYFFRSLYYVFLVPVLLPALRRMNDKMMMTASLPFLVFYFLGLGYLEQVPLLFYILPLAVAVHALLFNVGYHMDFSGASDDEEIGKEVGTRSAVSYFVKFISPLLGGLLIGTFGFNSTFLIGGGIMLLAVLPLFFFPKRTLPPDIRFGSVIRTILGKRFRSFNLSSFGYASEKIVDMIVWPIFLFIIIGGIEKLGGVISLGILAGAITTLGAGYLTDIGRRKKLISFSSGALSVIWIARLFIVRAFTAAGSHIIGNLLRDTLNVGWSSQYYRLAHRAENAGVFILSQETLFHLSRIITLPIFILLAYLLPISSFFPVIFVVAAALTPFFIFANKTSDQSLPSK